MTIICEIYHKLLNDYINYKSSSNNKKTSEENSSKVFEQLV